jgi:hypothetical protein
MTKAQDSKSVRTLLRTQELVVYVCYSTPRSRERVCHRCGFAIARASSSTLIKQTGWVRYTGRWRVPPAMTQTWPAPVRSGQLAFPLSPDSIPHGEPPLASTMELTGHMIYRGRQSVGLDWSMMLGFTTRRQRAVSVTPLVPCSVVVSLGTWSPAAGASVDNVVIPPCSRPRGSEPEGGALTAA